MEGESCSTGDQAHPISNDKFVHLLKKRLVLIREE